ncbi:hypothetical protein [Tessaracoccus antarcticus]|uniref:Uncharacterized protein n=1 Tax=Tessaracoccus antarcticus TaxID=2479848 RepID=A0A3M0GKA1_9ACTN|nr:hypothetical protein [Tessaracoccus antarcticus]RMB62043.1 hypothetical protein EAX62_05510 [Tessaracoccus antarcticus]
MNDPEIHDPDISDNLRRIVPDDLSPARLVDGARRKRARRNGVVGALAALALVAVAVPVALNLPADGPTVAQPATTTSQTPDVRQGEEPGGVPSLPGARACYNDDGTPISWSQVQTGPAEPGAVKAWFCGDYSPETGIGFVGPIEPLTSGLDTLIADVQAADVIDLTVTSCLADYNLSFNAVFEYPDGSRRIIGGDRHGCRTTYDGGVARAGADEFYGALYNAWVKQRQSDTGDWVVPNICPGPLSLIEMNPWDAVQGSLCGEGTDGSRSATYLSDALVAEVTKSMRASLEPPEENTPQPTSSAPEQRIWLTLSNKFTDYLSLVRHEDGLYRARDGEGQEWFWKPSEALSAKLDAALEEAGPTDVPPAGQPVGPGSSAAPEPTTDPGHTSDAPQPYVAEGCKDAASGDLASTELPDGALPEDAERVWLCASGEMQVGSPAPPLEPLEEAGLVSQAAAAFNDLSPVPEDQACTMELGPAYLVVHEYADGTRHAVELQEYGCHLVIGGATVKGNSELYKEKLLELWRQQRADLDTAQTRPGPLCPLTGSVFSLLSENVTATSGVTCVATGAGNDSSTAAHEAAIPAELLAQINTGIASAPLGVPAVAPDGDSIVLLTKAGDPFVLYRLEDGTFYWSEGEYARLWTPMAGTAEVLTPLFGK